MHPKGLIAALTTVIAIGLVFNELPVVFGHELKDHDVLVQGGHVRVKRQGGAGPPPPPPASGEIDVTTTTTNAHDQTTLITSSNEITSATDNPPDEPTADESDSSDNDTDSESATDPAVTVVSIEFTDHPSEATTENSGEQSPSDPPDPDTESTADPELTDDSNSTGSIDEPDETTAVGSEEQVTSPQTIEPDINIDVENAMESSNTSLSATTELNDSADEATAPNSSGEGETTIITDQEETDDETGTPVAPEVTIEIDVHEAPDNSDVTTVPNSGEQVLSTTQSGLNPPPVSNESTDTGTEPAVESVTVEHEFDDDDDNATTVIDDTTVPSNDTEESASGETSPPDQEPQLTSGEQPSTDAPTQTDLHLETEVDFSATTVPVLSGEVEAVSFVLPLDENPVESTATTAQISAQLGPTNHQNLDGTELTTEQPAASEENVASHETSASPSIEAEDSAIERPNVEPIPDVDLPEEETDAESDEGSNSGTKPTEDGISVDVTQNPTEAGAGNIEVGGETEVTTLSDAITQPPAPSDGIEQQTTPSTGETSNESIIDAQNDKPGSGSGESTESPNVEVPTQSISVDDDDVLASVVATTVRVPENSDQVPETSREDSVTRQPDAGSGEGSSEDEQSVRPATTTTEETTTTTTTKRTTTLKQADATTTAAEENEESLFSKHKYAIIGGAAAVALAAGAVALVNKQAIMQALNMNNVSPQLANPYEGLPMSATSADMMLPQLV